MACLRGLAIDDVGLDRESKSINFCSSCLAALRNRRLPALAVANGLQFGRLPSELQGLTWAEQRLIAIYRVTVDLIDFRNENIPGDMKIQTGGYDHQPRFKGNCCCVPQDTIAVNKYLPPGPEQLVEDFQVGAVLLISFMS